MRKFAAIVAVLALAALPAAFACDKEGAKTAAASLEGPAKDVVLTGYLTDSNCGAANANAKGKSCALACVKKGAKVQLAANDMLYTLDRTDIAADKFGVEVKVSGTLYETSNTIKVASIEAVQKG